MSAPIVAVQPIIQLWTHDCGICVLAMLLGKSYQEVDAVSLKLYPKVHERGLYISQFKRIARMLGTPLWRVSMDALADLPCGIILFHYHVALWFNGCLINPGDGLVWEPDAFYATKHLQPLGALVPRERTIGRRAKS